MIKATKKMIIYVSCIYRCHFGTCKQSIMCDTPNSHTQYCKDGYLYEIKPKLSDIHFKDSLMSITCFHFNQGDVNAQNADKQSPKHQSQAETNLDNIVLKLNGIDPKLTIKISERINLLPKKLQVMDNNKINKPSDIPLIKNDISNTQDKHLPQASYDKLIKKMTDKMIENAEAELNELIDKKVENAKAELNELCNNIDEIADTELNELVDKIINNMKAEAYAELFVLVDKVFKNMNAELNKIVDDWLIGIQSDELADMSFPQKLRTPD